MRCLLGRILVEVLVIVGLAIFNLVQDNPIQFRNRKAVPRPTNPATTAASSELVSTRGRVMDPWETMAELHQELDDISMALADKT